MQEIFFQRNILSLKDKMFRIALRITLSPMEAEDVVQEAMLKMWNKRDEWHLMESVEAFCLTIVKNLSLDKLSEKNNHTLSIGALEEDQSDGITPFEFLSAKEELGLFRSLMDELPEQQRNILWLREVEEKSYDEIVKFTGLSEQQVKVYLFRARQKIKKRFTEINEFGL